MPFQALYLASLAEPAIGFAASQKFVPAPFPCPRCAGPVWVRIRSKSRSPIGVTCSKCSWLSSYVLRPPPTRLPTQQDLNLTGGP